MPRRGSTSPVLQGWTAGAGGGATGGGSGVVGGAITGGPTGRAGGGADALIPASRVNNVAVSLAISGRLPRAYAALAARSYTITAPSRATPANRPRLRE